MTLSVEVHHPTGGVGRAASTVELPAEISTQDQRRAPPPGRRGPARRRAAGHAHDQDPRRGARWRRSRTARRAPAAPARARCARSHRRRDRPRPAAAHYEQRTPKKMKAAALRGALSDRARNDRVFVVSSLVRATPRRRRRRRRRWFRVSRPPGTCWSSPSARRADLDEPAQRAERAPARAGPAEHLRRAEQRRRRVHRGRAREFVAGPARRPGGLLRGSCAELPTPDVAGDRSPPPRASGRPTDSTRGAHRAGSAHAADSPRPRQVTTPVAGPGATRPDARAPRPTGARADVRRPPGRAARSGHLGEELRAAGREQVHVPRPPEANKTQIKIAVEKVFGVKVPTSTPSTARASASAPARLRHPAQRQARIVDAARRRPHRRVRTDWLIDIMAIRRYKPTTPGRRGSVGRRLRRGHP